MRPSLVNCADHARSLFDGLHRLDRVSHRLARSIGGPVPGDLKARKRWHWLLNAASKNLPVETRLAICSVLDEALRDTTVDSVQFNAQVKGNPGDGFQLDGGNSNKARIRKFKGKSICMVMLNCEVDQQLKNPGAGKQDDPPAPDGGEKPIN